MLFNHRKSGGGEVEAAIAKRLPFFGLLIEAQFDGIAPRPKPLFALSRRKRSLVEAIAGSRF
jgi:hypothetical protein